MQVRHRLSAAATRDIARLFRESIKAFGLAHASSYIARLDKTFLAIAESPEASPLRSEYRGSVRIRRFEAHHIVYRVDPKEVVIVRVLHGPQDIGRNL